MLISYVPGEETRVAVVEHAGEGGGRNGPKMPWRLEEYHAERAGHISRVGNIYHGVVSNVESSIQAAFIDFGFEQHGFLHVTDLHPRYFPGEDDETTEMVGKKTPRRERPPIQRCLRRGDRIEVQVLKDGVGTKGPTLTSYLSIPGRFLVMMPQMDRVGVSRKVEDEDQRREMRAILDQLELPEGFGFILRTAGMDRTKTELKRDLAYLQRLWKDMEARKGDGSKPALLYSESDLLVRALRDLLTPEIEEVIIDHESALKRATGFLKIVAPRAKTRLLHHTSKFPLFHAFGIEPQITAIHAREVPLPSGGRLVIDETEALVAIDVNSGKMRDASDSETNAYRTNLEAVDEICRQMKLRDLGGIIINDLIDMRHASHRKDIEQRMRDRLKRDRARTTTLAISQFGILEMTRQRMRGSQETQNFSDCPTCKGRGLVQRPDSVAGDALRELALLLAHEQVAKVEMVVSPRIAGEYLSSRRRELGRVERGSGKHVDVRVSEAVPIDRVTFYAYDAAGADIDLEKLPRVKVPRDLKVWEEVGSWAVEADEPAPDAEPEPIHEETPHPIEIDEPFEDSDGGGETRQRTERGGADRQEGGDGDQGGRRRRRRRRGRGGRGGDGLDPRRAEQAPREGAPVGDEVAVGDQDGAMPLGDAGDDRSEPPHEFNDSERPQSSGAPGDVGQGEGGRRRRRRRRRRGRGGNGAPMMPDGSVEAGPGPGPELADEPAAVGRAPMPMPIDDSAPRGDSWDLEPSELPPMPARGGQSRPREEPPRRIRDDSHDAASIEPKDAGPIDHESERAIEDEGDRSPEGGAIAEGQEEGGGRRRRRRRGGRGRGRGGPEGEGRRPSEGEPSRAVPPGEPRQPRENRSSGPMHGNAPRPASPPSGHRGEQQAAPTGAGGPRFLYSSRRKLAPGEIPKQRRE